MKRLILFTSILFSVLFLSCKQDSESFIRDAAIYNAYNIQENQFDATVIDVSDGDYFTIRFDYDKPNFCAKEEKARLLGVSCPRLNLYTDQSAEYYAVEAAAYSSGLVGGKVVVEFDNIASARDPNKNIQIYIWTDSGLTLFNKKLLSEGYGRYDSSRLFNSDRMKSFETAEKSANQAHKGLWN